MFRRKALIAATAGIALVLSGCSALSGSGGGGGTGADPDAEFPGSAPITFIVPLNPGGSTDLMIRGLMAFVEEEIGTKIIVENKPGAGGQVGITELSGSPADGHTIGSTNLPSALAYVNPDKQATYDQDSFQPIASVNQFRGLIAASSTGKWTTLEEMVDAAKAAPGTVTVGIDGLGGDDHIAVVQFEEAAGVEFKIVPFDDGSEKMTALIGNQIDLSFGAVPTFKAQIDTGTLIPLAALDPDPIPGFDGVPTATSEGYDVYWESYNVISAPVGISEEVLTALEDAIQKGSEAAIADPDFSAQLEAGGYVFGFEDSAWATDKWTELDEKWRELVPLALAQN